MIEREISLELATAKYRAATWAKAEAIYEVLKDGHLTPAGIEAKVEVTEIIYKVLSPKHAAALESAQCAA